MARLTIPDEATSADFTVTTEQSVFPFSFAIFEKADLKVQVNGLTVAQSEFTFTGARLDGGGYKGGVVTLNTPAQPGSVRVWRRIKPVRPSNFASQTSVPVRTVDMELNKVVALQQDVMLALEDVEAGVVDPDLLTEVVDEATAFKANRSGDTFTGPVNVLLEGGEAPDTRKAQKIGTAFAALAVFGGAEAAPFVPDLTVFQDFPRSRVTWTPEGVGDHIDFEMKPKGQGKMILGRSIFKARAFGQRDNTTVLTFMLNPPETEELNAGGGISNPGDAQAAVNGLVPFGVAGAYPDIDMVAGFGRCYGTRDLPYAVEAYGVNFVRFAAPLPPEAPVIITGALQTAHTPKWLRGIVTGISVDRRTVYVYGWDKQKNYGDPVVTGEIPPVAPCYACIFTKGFTTNFAAELLGPEYERNGAGRLVWRDNTTKAIIPYAGGEPTATRPAAAINAYIGQVKPAYVQTVMSNGELGCVNTKGPLGYDGTEIYGGYAIKGERGMSNFVFGWDVVDGNSSYIDPVTGAIVVGESAFAVRARGRFRHAFPARDFVRGAFVAENGYDNHGVAFLDERATTGGGVSFRVDTPDRGITSEIGMTGNATWGSRSVIGNVNHQYFANGNGNASYRFGVAYGADSYVEAKGGIGAAVIGVQGAATNSDLGLNAKGGGVIAVGYGAGAGDPGPTTHFAFMKFGGTLFKLHLTAA